MFKQENKYNTIYIYIYIYYRSKVWDHPDNFVSSMKIHTFIHQMNIKYSQDIDKVRNND